MRGTEQDDPFDLFASRNQVTVRRRSDGPRKAKARMRHDQRFGREGRWGLLGLGVCFGRSFGRSFGIVEKSAHLTLERPGVVRIKEACDAGRADRSHRPSLNT